MRALPTQCIIVRCALSANTRLALAVHFHPFRRVMGLPELFPPSPTAGPLHRIAAQPASTGLRFRTALPATTKKTTPSVT